MVDCTGLENRRGVKAFVGSNPTPSAICASRCAELTQQVKVFVGANLTPSAGRCAAAVVSSQCWCKNESAIETIQHKVEDYFKIDDQSKIAANCEL